MQIKHKTDAHNMLEEQRRHLICLQTWKVLRNHEYWQFLTKGPIFKKS